MSTTFTTMSRNSQNRYDVTAWMNKDDELEVKVYDHRFHRNVAHLVEKETSEPTEGDVFASLLADSRSSIKEGYQNQITLKFFENINREAPEYSENTMYWNLDDDSFGWARHPLQSWRSAAASNEFIAFENLYDDGRLENVLAYLREEYMKNAQEEVPVHE